MKLTKVEAGSYKIVAGELRFEVSQVKGGSWFLIGLGDAAAMLLKLHRFEGADALKRVRRRLATVLETPEAQLFQRALALKGGEKGEFDLGGIDPEHVPLIAMTLNDMRFSTYISSGKLGAQR